MNFKNEDGYKRLLSLVCHFGHQQEDRTGVGTISVFDGKVEYDGGNFNCLSTIRPAPLRLAFEEMWFFLRGEHDTLLLENKGVNFWKGNTSREYLDKIGLESLPEKSMGAAYGKQWRNYSGSTDQLKNLIDELRANPNSRRLMIDLWNPHEHKDMCLTPCWFNMQVVVIGDTLHMKLRNRSVDILFGYSFAVQQYRLLQLCLCKMFGYRLGKLSVDLAHIHIYKDQVEYVKETLNRSLGTQGQVYLDKDISTLEDLLSIKWEDFRVEGLEVNQKQYKTPRPNMAV